MNLFQRPTTLVLALTLALSPLVAVSDTTIDVSAQPPAAVAKPSTTSQAPSSNLPTPNKPTSKKLPTTIPPININAPSWALMDYASGQILAGQDEHKHMAPASLSKIMTAYVVAQALADKHIAWTDMVTVSPQAARTGGSKMFLKPNEKVSVQNLMNGMIVESGNDATVALAEYLAGSETAFVEMMNQTAVQLGMKDTHFVNANGLPNPDQYSSAYDLAILSRALIMNFPEEYKLHSQKSFSWNGIKQLNRNRLLFTNPKVDGLKTGYTETAKYCMVATAKDADTRVIAVVMGAQSPNIRTAETQKLLAYGFRFYHTDKLYGANQPIQNAKVWYGNTNQVAVGVTHDLLVTTPRNQPSNLQANLTLQAELIAPIAQGQEVGTITVTSNGKPILTAPVVALNAVEKGNIWQRSISWVKHLFN